MYVVPLAVRNRGPAIKQIFALLERNGTYLISLGPGDGVEIAREFAELNGLVLTADPVQAGELVFLSVDPDRTDFSAFYSWREVLPGTAPSKEVWRQFTWVSESLGVNQQLNDILVGQPNHSIYSVLSAYLKTFG